VLDGAVYQRHGDAFEFKGFGAWRCGRCGSYLIPEEQGRPTGCPLCGGAAP
jgi:rubrerythrin